MRHRCQFCQRDFSPRYNRHRHENDVCIKRSREDQKELASQYSMDEDSPAGLNGGTSEDDNETGGEDAEPIEKKKKKKKKKKKLMIAMTMTMTSSEKLTTMTKIMKNMTLIFGRRCVR